MTSTATSPASTVLGAKELKAVMSALPKRKDKLYMLAKTLAEGKMSAEQIFDVMESDYPGVTQAVRAMRQPGVLAALTKAEETKRRVTGPDQDAAKLLFKFFNGGNIELEHQGFSETLFPALYLDDNTIDPDALELEADTTSKMVAAFITYFSQAFLKKDAETASALVGAFFDGIDPKKLDGILAKTTKSLADFGKGRVKRKEQAKKKAKKDGDDAADGADAEAAESEGSDAPVAPDHDQAADDGAEPMDEDEDEVVTPTKATTAATAAAAAPVARANAPKTPAPIRAPLSRANAPKKSVAPSSKTEKTTNKAKTTEEKKREREHSVLSDDDDDEDDEF